MFLGWSWDVFGMIPHAQGSNDAAQHLLALIGYNARALRHAARSPICEF